MNDFASAADAVLEFLRQQLGFELAIVSRRDGERYLVLRAHDDTYGVSAGDLLPWDDTFCAAMVRGEAPNMAPDISTVPAWVAAAEGLGMDVGAYLTYPMTDADGVVLGTVCAASPTVRDDSLLAVDRQLRLLTDMLGTILRTERRLQDITRRSEQARDEADRDPLTGIGNRRLWDRMLIAEEERCRRYGLTALVVVVDLDGLKERNDRDGHAAGDALLCEAGVRLGGAVRDSDVVARLGGDEFGVLLADCDPRKGGLMVARLQDALAEGNVEASCGWTARLSGVTLAEAWASADADMYAVKLQRKQARRSSAAPSPRRSPFPALAHSEADGDIAALLGLVRQHLDLPVALVNRLTGGQQIVTHIDADGEPPIPVGPISGSASLCAEVLAGELPSIIPDVRAKSGCTGIPIVDGRDLQAYVSVPIVLGDGSVYGTLCCFGYEQRPDLNERDGVFMSTVADAVARHIEHDSAQQRRRHGIVQAVDRVIAEQQLRMVFQPVRNLTTGELIGYEALARFDAEPIRPPDVWFAEAGEVGLGTELEQLAVRCALRALGGFEGLLGMNVSAATAITPGFAALFSDIPMHRIVLELTEHEAVTDYDAVRTALAPLRARGMRLAVDDVGAGFSSLAHVVRLAPDSIKIDRSLITGMAEDPTRSAMAAALAAYARRTGANAVAEGIETRADLEACREVGIALGQGWLLGRPGELPARIAAAPAA